VVGAFKKDFLISRNDIKTFGSAVWENKISPIPFAKNS
jgi:hypothetical protein